MVRGAWTENAQSGLLPLGRVPLAALCPVQWQCRPSRQATAQPHAGGRGESPDSGPVPVAVLAPLLPPLLWRGLRLCPAALHTLQRCTPSAMREGPAAPRDTPALRAAVSARLYAPAGKGGALHGRVQPSRPGPSPHAGQLALVACFPCRPGSFLCLLEGSVCPVQRQAPRWGEGGSLAGAVPRPPARSSCSSWFLRMPTGLGAHGPAPAKAIASARPCAVCLGGATEPVL